MTRRVSEARQVVQADPPASEARQVAAEPRVSEHGGRGADPRASEARQVAQRDPRGPVKHGKVAQVDPPGQASEGPGGYPLKTLEPTQRPLGHRSSDRYHGGRPRRRAE